MLPIPSFLAKEAWTRAEPHLARAAETTEKTDLESMLIACVNGDAMLWLVVDDSDGVVLAALVTDVEDFLSGWRVMRVIAGAGVEMKRWDKLVIEAIEKVARELGCNSVEIIGRKGWGRIYPDYTLIEHVYSKEL